METTLDRKKDIHLYIFNAFCWPKSSKDYEQMTRAGQSSSFKCFEVTYDKQEEASALHEGLVQENSLLVVHWAFISPVNTFFTVAFPWVRNTVMQFPLSESFWF